MAVMRGIIVCPATVVTRGAPRLPSWKLLGLKLCKQRQDMSCMSQMDTPDTLDCSELT